MEATEVVYAPTRVELLREGFERARDLFGLRLKAVYLLSEDPYEPRTDDENLHVVFVVGEGGDIFEDGSRVVDVLYPLGEERGVWVVGHLAHPDDKLARATSLEGVRV